MTITPEIALKVIGIWYGIGFVTMIGIIYLDWKDGRSVILLDIRDCFCLAFAGPLMLTFFLYVCLQDVDWKGFWNKELIKGRRIPKENTIR